MSVLFVKHLVSSSVRFIISFLRVLVVYGTRKVLKILVLIGAYLFKTIKKSFQKSHTHELRIFKIYLAKAVFITVITIFVKNKENCCYGYCILKAHRTIC